MRFLTREWHAGVLSDGEADALEVAHATHLAAILPQVSSQLQEFHTAVSIHDGLLQSAVLDHRDASLQLLLRCGDQQQGYRDVALTYSGLDTPVLGITLLALIANDPASEALYVEIDRIEEYSYEHRWLWWPFRRELDIQFRDFSFSVHPQPSRDFERRQSAFREIRANAG